MSKEERAQARADKAARKAARPWPLRHWMLTGIGAIVVIGGIASAASSGGSNGTSTPAASDQTVQSSAAPVDTTPTEAATTPPPAVPQQLLDITGSGTKTTQKFTAAGDWDLSYSYDCSNFGQQGNFQVYIYGDDGNLSLANDGVNQLGAKGSDVDHYHHGGTYYFEINSECNWHVTVAG